MAQYRGVKTALGSSGNDFFGCEQRIDSNEPTSIAFLILPCKPKKGQVTRSFSKEKTIKTGSKDLLMPQVMPALNYLPR